MIIFFKWVGSTTNQKKVLYRPQWMDWVLGVGFSVEWNVAEPDSQTLANPFCDFGMFGIHPGRLTWFTYKSPIWKGKWFSKPPWLCSMLIFRGVCLSKAVEGSAFWPAWYPAMESVTEKRTMKVALAADSTDLDFRIVGCMLVLQNPMKIPLPATKIAPKNDGFH